MPAPVSAIPFGISFQAALANFSDRLNADNRTASAEAKTRSAASAASRPESKPDQTQLPYSDAAIAAPPVLPVDEKAAPAEKLPNPQDGAGTSDVSSNAAAGTPDFSIPGSSPDASPQLSAAQPRADAAEPAASALPQSNAPAQNKVTDPMAQAGASNAATALDAAVASSAATQAGTDIVPALAAGTPKLQITPSMAAVLPNRADAIQSAGKAPQKNSADATAAKNALPSNAADTTPSKTTGTAGDGSSHSAQSNSQNNGQSDNQPTPHAQAGASQSEVPLPKAVDSGAAQPQSVPIPSLSPDAPHATAAAGSLPDASQTDRTDTSASALDGDEVAPATGINASRIVQSMSETEMRVGLHSNEFGAISIRTSVSPQQMLAQISLDHTGLSQAISAHVASVQTKLGNDSGLNTLIQVNHQAASTAGQGSSQQREQRSSALSVPVEGAAVTADPDAGISPAVLAGASRAHRLDIRA
jgi:hypothetical protein